MQDRIRVLYVDDEENNLIAFRSFFRKEYEVYTVTTVSEAWRLLESMEIQIIVSDQRMPGTLGTDFLEKTIQKYPDSIRLLITGQSDINTVIEAINRGQITKYLQKPWDWNSFRITLEHCADLYNSRREMKVKNDQLQKANDELNRFVYSASHDLRSPLMSILGVTELAKTDETLVNASYYLDLIERSVLKLDDYIKNIIDYYQNSRSEELLEHIDFASLAQDVVDSLKNQDQSVQFELDIMQGTEFISDNFRLRVILSNLVSNAIKYQNPQNQRHLVEIKIVTDSQNAHLVIGDNGIGILNEHLENIFKMFFRAENTNSKQGTGIGLYIVKEALERIGGTINVKSTPFIGTSFEIIIPNRK